MGMQIIFCMANGDDYWESKIVNTTTAEEASEQTYENFTEVKNLRIETNEGFLVVGEQALKNGVLFFKNVEEKKG